MTNVFTPNTPQAGNFPANDQPLMNDNFQYLNGFGSRDHQFTKDTANTNDGTHKQVTLTDEAAPGFAGASSALFSNTANGQSQLFFQNNTPATVQLTTIKTGVPTLAANGVSFLPGGLLIQWGTGANNITFPIAFATVYSATATPTSSSLSGPAGMTVLTNTGLTMANNAGQVFNSHWIAIGLA